MQNSISTGVERHLSKNRPKFTARIISGAKITVWNCRYRIWPPNWFVFFLFDYIFHPQDWNKAKKFWRSYIWLAILAGEEWQTERSCKRSSKESNYKTQDQSLKPDVLPNCLIGPSINNTALGKEAPNTQTLNSTVIVCNV